MNGQSQARHDGASDWLLGALKQNPEGLLLLAAGCALLLRKSSSTAMAWSGNTPSASGNAPSASGIDSNRFARTAEGATQYATDIARQTKEAASSYAASAVEYADQARQAVGEQSKRVMEQAGSAAQTAVNRMLQEQPLVVAIAGLAAGAAIAAAFPATEIEKQTLGAVGEQMTNAAQRMGEQVKEAAGAAGDKLKAAAEARGLTPDGMTDVAKDVAKEVASAFSSNMSGSNTSGSNMSGRSQQTDGAPSIQKRRFEPGQP